MTARRTAASVAKSARPLLDYSSRWEVREGPGHMLTANSSMTCESARKTRWTGHTKGDKCHALIAGPEDEDAPSGRRCMAPGAFGASGTCVLEACDIRDIGGVRLSITFGMERGGGEALDQRLLRYPVADSLFREQLTVQGELRMQALQSRHVHAYGK